jgi:hypothetical protein
MDYIDEYFNYVQKEGLTGLLPQNMPDYILQRMLNEIGAAESNKDDIEASTLLLAVLSIQSGTLITENENNLTLKFEPPEEFMEKFENYKLSLSMEHMRRIKKISISTNTLPTLLNILDSNREVGVSVLQ